MCQGLPELRQAMAAYAAGFDAALVPPAALAGLLADAGAIERTASAISSMAAARMASCPAAPARHVAEALARASGTSLADARRAIEAGRAMASLPEVAAAALAGELSRQQASLVAGAALANPAATGQLLAAARTASLSELAESAGRARAAAAGLEAQRQLIRQRRSLRQWADQSGTWHLHASGLPEDGARIMAALGPFADKAFEAARKQGRRERPEAYGFDALVALANAGGAGTPRYEVMVRVDQAALLRGYALDDETCELPGFGTVTPQAVCDMIDTGDPVLKAIVTKGKDVIGVAHLGRRPTAHQQSALDWLFPTCGAEGCGTRAGFLQTDHRADWAKTRVTMFDLLDRLCPYHHRLKTYQGWCLVGGKGKRPFVPPDDPRHPGHPGRGQSPGAPPRGPRPWPLDAVPDTRRLPGAPAPCPVRPVPRWQPLERHNRPSGAKTGHGRRGRSGDWRAERSRRACLRPPAAHGRAAPVPGGGPMASPTAEPRPPAAPPAPRPLSFTSPAPGAPPARHGRRGLPREDRSCGWRRIAVRRAGGPGGRRVWRRCYKEADAYSGSPKVTTTGRWSLLLPTPGRWFSKEIPFGYRDAVCPQVLGGTGCWSWARSCASPAGGGSVAEFVADDGGWPIVSC